MYNANALHWTIDSHILAFLPRSASLQFKLLCAVILARRPKKGFSILISPFLLLSLKADIDLFQFRIKRDMDFFFTWTPYSLFSNWTLLFSYQDTTAPLNFLHINQKMCPSSPTSKQAFSWGRGHRQWQANAALQHLCSSFRLLGNYTSLSNNGSYLLPLLDTVQGSHRAGLTGSSWYYCRHCWQILSLPTCTIYNVIRLRRTFLFFSFTFHTLPFSSKVLLCQSKTYLSCFSQRVAKAHNSSLAWTCTDRESPAKCYNLYNILKTVEIWQGKDIYKKLRLLLVGIWWVSREWRMDPILPGCLIDDWI